MLVARDSACRDDALTSLAARDWQAIERDDPYGAMEELCVREQAATSRAAWGIDRTEHAALLVVEPARWRELDQLVDAIRRYVPAAGVWLFEDQELREIVPPRPRAETSVEPAPTATASRTPPPYRPTHAAPPLRLAGVDDATPSEDAADPEAVAADTERPDGTRSSDSPTEISAEEIRMLLGSEERPS